MPRKPNYSFERKQREKAKAEKREAKRRAKRQAKIDAKAGPEEATRDDAAAETKPGDADSEG